MMIWRRAFSAAAVALLAGRAAGQTSTTCDPLDSTTCSSDAALGMSIDVDFTQGEVNSFTASGTPTYGSDGVTFTISESGDAPQLNSVFYIMFGRVSITLKSAPGAGIVTSFVMESDDLDEIDMEWLGSDTTEVQTNYFGKGITGTYNRGKFNPAANAQDEFITYTVDWTSERIVWIVGEVVVRSMTMAEAESGQYPQSPMKIKFGIWAGGDSSNPSGTIGWARGPTDYSDGPFSAVVRSISVTDYSTGSAYEYGDESGDWTSIEAVGGSVNGNLDGGGALTTTASAAAATGSSPTIPLGGIASGTVTPAGPLPSGWIMTANGRILPASDAPAVAPSYAIVLIGPLICAVFALFGAGWRP